MQTERRQTPYPFTWEIPAGVSALAGFAVLLGVHAGRGLANWFAGAGWHWPRSVHLFTSLPAVLAGDATAGLAASVHPTAAPSQVLAWVVAAEIFIVAVGVAAAVVWLRHWGPGRLKGMATATEAEHVLGLHRLRRDRHVIRPDLYPSRTQRTTPQKGGRHERRPV